MKSSKCCSVSQRSMENPPSKDAYFVEKLKIVIRVSIHLIKFSDAWNAIFLCNFFLHKFPYLIWGFKFLTNSSGYWWCASFNFLITRMQYFSIDANELSLCVNLSSLNYYKNTYYYYYILIRVWLHNNF